MSSTSIITPGENIASAADWKAGEGTMIQGEQVISTMTGIVNFNQDEKTISIASDCKGVPEVNVGDTVIAEIAKIRESMLEARILHVEGDDGREPMPQHLYGQIHVTKMVDRYLHDASDGVRRRDIIRATVTDNKPVIRLDMRSGDDCGVLQAICPQCGNQLITAEHEDWNVACSYCNYLSFRALSKSFGLGYNSSSDDTPDYNKSGKRWGKEAEQYFAIGPAARSNLIATDFRNDGREVEHFRFEGTGGGGGGRGGGRKERPTGRKIFVGGLSREVSDDDLLEAFKKFGKVVDHVVMKDRETGNNRGFGFVTFAKDEDGDKAISGLNKQDFMGRRLTVNDAGDKKGDKKPQKKVEGTRLYVGGLPWKINNAELTKVFSEHGKVNDCHIVMDGDRSKGFGFVTVDDESADKVIESLDGQEIQGRRLKVAKAKARSDSKGGRRDNRNGGKPQRTSREMQARKEEGLKD
jgi:RNA recognition motif-containing protein/exosome complex RNA-binding protein Csl4